MMAFQAYERPLVAVVEFNYIGRLMIALDDYWPVVVGNLRKAWKRWARMSSIFGQEGAYPRLPRTFKRRWYNLHSFLVQSCGWRHLRLGGPWEVSATGWPDSCQRCS